MNRVLTSGHGQRGELVLGNGKSGTVVRCDADQIPGGGVQVEHDKVAARLDVVRHLIPVNVISAQANQVLDNGRRDNLRETTYFFLYSTTK